MSIGFDPGLPELFSRFGLESAKAAIRRTGDEDQTTSSDNRSAKILCACIVNALSFKFVNYAERDSPNDVTCLQINSSFQSVRDSSTVARVAQHEYPAE